MSEVLLRVRELRKTFDPGLFKAKKKALDGLDLEVRRGEIFGFLGPNGAGKTTTIKAITGLIFPDSGEITIGGLPHRALEARRMIGFMPESPYFYHHLSGEEFLRFYGQLLGLARGVLGERVAEVLEILSMTHHAAAPMRTYSKGMLQRVALAQALLGRPELLILDEPMSGLDPVGRRDVRDLILAERERGTTVFFSSHIIPDVETICDRVAVVDHGRVRAVGAVRDIVARDAEGYELSFAGVDPSALQTPVLAQHPTEDGAWVRVDVAHCDALIRELVGAGARILSLTPVRGSLEDFLLEHSGGGER